MRLAGAVRVEDAQRDGLHPPQSADGVREMLGREFADRIGRVGVRGVVFPGRAVQVAVDGARGSQHKSADARVAHGLQQGDGAADVGCVVLARIQDRFGHAHPGGQVADHVHALEHRPHAGDVGDIAALEMHGRVQPLGVAAAQVIHGPHRMAACDQRIGERGTEETGAASDEDFHVIPGASSVRARPADAGADGRPSAPPLPRC